MRLFAFLPFLLALAGSALAAETPPAMAYVHMIGDSTMADKKVWPPQPERGWGQLFPLYFREPHRVVNHAANGRSTKSFIDEGRWEQVRASLRPGDWLIIQFGHNDEKKDKPAVYADAETAYPENLRRFVTEARAAGATPVLATPIARRRFNEDGTLIDTHGAYPASMRRVATAENVPLLELNTLTTQLLERYGVERSKDLFLWIPETDYPSRAGSPESRPGRSWEDDTHLSAIGASRVAELAIDEILRLNLEIKVWLKLPSERNVSP